MTQAERKKMIQEKLAAKRKKDEAEPLMIRDPNVATVEKAAAEEA